MSLLNIIEKKHTNIPKLDENIIDGSKLLLDIPNKNKKKIEDEIPVFKDSSISHLYNIRNLKKPLGFFYYLNETNFIGVLSNEEIYNIKTYNDLYKIYLNSLFNVNIIEINIADKNIINNIHLVIVKTSYCELFKNKKQLDLIKSSDFLNCEQINNIFITQDKDANTINLNVEQITMNSVIVNSKHKMLPGSPIYTNNILIGIFYFENNDKLMFFRISHFLDWIYKFTGDYQQVKTSAIPKNVIFTQDHYYSIILDLNNKVENLENELKNREIRSIKMPFQGIIEKNTIANENEAKLLRIIDELTKRINDQDTKLNYIFENFKKMGF